MSRSSGTGGHPPVEAVEQRAVDARRAVDEPGRIDEVARAALVHDHGGDGEVGGEVADGAGVVEVDVGDDDPAQVGGAEPERGERRVHGGDARLRTGLDQRGHRPVDQEPGGELLHAAQQRVELMDPGCDLDRVAHGSPRISGYGVGLRRRLLGEQASAMPCRSACTLASSAP